MAVLVTIVIYEPTAETDQPVTVPEPAVEEAAPAVSVAPEPVDERISGRYLMVGTVVWDQGIESASQRADGSFDYGHPFAGLPTYQPETYDAWVADLECPISSDDVPSALGDVTFEFNCLPEFLPYAQEYFQFFNLANGHSANSGRPKLEATRRLLETTGIQHFGDPEPDRQELSCEVVALPVKLHDASGADQAAQLPAAFCAWHYFHRLPREGEIERLAEYGELMPVFAFLHMGAEYAPEADGYQQAMARRAIDAGADVVIANNPHWVQNAELYEGKLIVYSTGNFIFGQAFNEEVKRSANIIVEAGVAWDEALSGWLALGPECAAFGDDCLARAQAAGLAGFKFELDFDVVAGYLTRQQQAVADDAVQAAGRQRLGWDELFDQAED